MNETSLLQKLGVKKQFEFSYIVSLPTLQLSWRSHCIDSDFVIIWPFIDEAEIYFLFMKKDITKQINCANIILGTFNFSTNLFLKTLPVCI